MARTIVAIHTVHRPPVALAELLRRDARSGELARLALAIRDADPRDHLPRVVGRDVLHLAGDVHVPVDASSEPETLVPTADVHLHRGQRLTAFLVVPVLVDLADLVAVKLVGPMALLARLARGPHVPHGPGNRARVRVKRHREQLPCAGDFRLGERRRARADMALDARHARVRAVLVGHVFRLHHAVASLAAELRRIHVLDTAIRGERHDDDVGHRQQEHDDCSMTLHGIR